MAEDEGSDQNTSGASRSNFLCSSIKQPKQEDTIKLRKPVSRVVHHKDSKAIPALWLPKTSKKLMIYFHGNAEDIHISHEQCKLISNYVNVSVLAMEYPGYGLYRDNGQACETKLKEDAEYVYHYCLQHIPGLTEQDILIFGRSMGSGPACFLAGTFNPGGLIVMSGYASIRRVAGDVIGWLKFTVKEQFDNV